MALASGDRAISVIRPDINSRSIAPVEAFTTTSACSGVGVSGLTTPRSASTTVRDGTRPSEVRAQASVVSLWPLLKKRRKADKSPDGRTTAANRSDEIQASMAPLTGSSGVRPVQRTARPATSTIPISWRSPRNR
ncbi:hypothetical protein D3C77_393240 [compost metagenome]